MTSGWAKMLDAARELIGTTVHVAPMPTNPTFQLPFWTSVDDGAMLDASLKPGDAFQFVEVIESANGRRIAGRIEDIGWVNLAHRGSLVDDERPTWYIRWPRRRPTRRGRRR